MSLHSEHPTELEPGHAPAQNYEPIFATTRALILLLKKCADVYGRRPEEQQLARSLEYVYALQRFIEDPQTLHLKRHDYDARLDARYHVGQRVLHFSPAASFHDLKPFGGDGKPVPPESKEGLTPLVE